MKPLRAAAALFLCGLALALPACAGPTFVVQHYDGPARPPEAVAILRVHGSENVRVVRLDGEDAAAPIEQDVRLHIEVLPGDHSLSVVNVAAPERPAERVSFHAAAGGVYRVVFLKPAGSPAPEQARVYEVGRDSDALVRDVTAPPRDPEGSAP